MQDRQDVDKRVTMLPSVVIIKEEEDVVILQEELPELFPFLKWRNRLRAFNLAVLLLNLAGAGADLTRGVIDYLVSRTENPDSRWALQTLAKTEWGHLMQLRSAELVRGNQYYDAVRISWIQFCSAANQRAAKSLSKNLLKTAIKLHELLRKIAQQIGEVEQYEIKNVLTRLLKDVYLLKAKAAQGRKTREIKGLIAPIIKVINRLKAMEEISPEQARRRLVNLYIHIQDTAQVNVTWTGAKQT